MTKHQVIWNNLFKKTDIQFFDQLDDRLVSEIYSRLSTPLWLEIHVNFCLETYDE